MTAKKTIDILLIEDNPGDVLLISKALGQSKIDTSITVVGDGEEAIARLRRRGPGVRRPDLILLDLNIPKMDGREVLIAIKADPELHDIPVIILTSSGAERDIRESWQANCYVTKPADLEQFLSVVKSIEQFWIEIVMLPRWIDDPSLGRWCSS